MKMTSKRSPFLLLLGPLIASLLAYTPAGKAQTPTPAAPPAAATAGPEVSPALAPGVEFNELTLSSWGYEDVTLFGPSGLAAYDIGLPLHWEMKPGGSVTLNVTYLSAYGRVSANSAGVDQAAQSVRVAHVQVKLNSVLIYEMNLTEPGAHTLEIKFPNVWPARTSERDRLQVYLRVYGPCNDVVYSSLQVSKESKVRLVYAPGSLSLDLANYPAPFFQRTFLPSSAVMLLPENIQAPILEAALAVAAELGSRANNRVALRAMTDAEWNDAEPIREHTVLVGTPDENITLGHLLAEGQPALSVALRELEMTATGPGTTVPGSLIDVHVSVTNPTTTPVSDLSLVSRLPVEAANPACRDGCSLQGDQAKWEIGQLAPGERRAFRLSYTPAATAWQIELTSELLQGHKPINVASLQTQIAPGVQTTQTTTRPASSLLFIHNGHAVAESDGIIALEESPWQAGKALLLVTGLSNEAVLKAGHALATRASFPGMVGPVAFVQSVDLHPAAEETAPEGTPVDTAGGEAAAEDAATQAPNPVIAEDLSFAELGYEDITVSGTGMKEIYYQFDLPLGWALTEEAFIRLNYTHSPVLNPGESAITLLYNGTPIASATLTPATALSGELIGKLPPKRSLPGRANNLLVRVTLMLPDRCADPESTLAWLRIGPESGLHLAHYTQDIGGYLNLDAWPIPFAARADIADVLFALPENPAPLEAAIAIKLASYLGAASGGDYQRPHALLGQGDPAVLGGYHIMAIGRPSRSPLLQLANDELPQPFIAGSDGLMQQVDNVIFRLPEGLDLGILESIASPWSADRVFLAVTGTSDTGILQASDFMVNSNVNWELKGSLAMLRNGKMTAGDPQDLTTTGRLNAIATAAPGAQVVGTAAPTSPAATLAPSAETVAMPAPQSYPERYPYLLPLVIGAGALGMVAIGATILRQRRKDL